MPSRTSRTGLCLQARRCPAIHLPTKEPPAKMFYETDSVQPMEFHVLRLGDVAMATNPFELFLDYGIRMKTRSKAVLTMVVNISGANCGYLPTAKAVRGGGYSADNYLVGPEGGQVLVNETRQADQPDVGVSRSRRADILVCRRAAWLDPMTGRE